MTAFLNRNRNFVDLTQCGKIAVADLENHLPSNLTIDVQQGDVIVDVERMLAQCFSAPLEDM